MQGRYPKQKYKLNANLSCKCSIHWEPRSKPNDVNNLTNIHRHWTIKKAQKIETKCSIKPCGEEIGFNRNLRGFLIFPRFKNVTLTDIDRPRNEFIAISRCRWWESRESPESGRMKEGARRRQTKIADQTRRKELRRCCQCYAIDEKMRSCSPSPHSVESFRICWVLGVVVNPSGSIHDVLRLALLVSFSRSKNK